jgi:hypothetical protein
MTIPLAPMDGLLDFVLRDILTRAGGIDTDPGLALPNGKQDRDSPPHAIGAYDAEPHSEQHGRGWPALLPLVADLWQIIAAHISPLQRSVRLK